MAETVAAVGTRPLVALAITLLLLGVEPRAATAVFGAIDVVPAATLLLPYFEVALTADDDEATTRFWVRNASEDAVIAHGVLWTDLGVPTQTFNIPLPASASAEVDLRELFLKGTMRFPAFGDDCKQLEDELDPRLVDDLQTVHTGGRSDTYFAGDCAGTAFGDRVARGFITIDVVNECSVMVPTENHYFDSPPSGLATDDNVLWGEFILAERRRGRSQAEPMVHIEAQPGFSQGTFYFHIYGSSGSDHREPLPRRVGVRYLHQLTDIVCWRDIIASVPFECGSDPPAQTHGGPFFPALSPVLVQAYDHDSNLEVFAAGAAPCHLTTARTTVGSELLPVTAKTGWLVVDAEPSFDAVPFGFTASAYQLYLAPIHRIHPRGLSAETGGVALDEPVALPLAPLPGEAP